MSQIDTGPLRRALLDLLAVAYTPLAPSVLVNLVAMQDFAAGIAATQLQKQTKATLKLLVEQDLVMEESGFRLSPEQRDPLLRALLADRAALMRLVAQIQLEAPYPDRSSSSGPLRVLRQLRLAVYTDDQSSFLSLYNEARLVSSTPLLDFVPPEMVAGLNHELLGKLAIELESAPVLAWPEIRQKLHRRMSELAASRPEDSVRFALAEEYFWMGRFTELSDLLRGRKSARAHALLGRVALCSGALPAAQAAFSAMAALGGSPTQRDQLFEGLHLLAVGTAAALARLRPDADPRLRDDILLLRLLRLNGTQVKLPEAKPIPDFLPWIQAIYRCWSGNSLGESLILRLQVLTRQAHAAELDWLASECEKLCKHPSPSPVAALVVPVEPWQHSLEQLDRLLSSEAAVTAVQSRLIWCLDSFQMGWLVEAREQQASDRGWTTGKAIDPQNPKEGSRGSWTNQDRAAMAILAARTARHGHRSAGIVEHVSDLLQALVGHPLLFWGNDRKPFRIEQQELSLALQEEADGTRLLLLLHPWIKGDYLARWVDHDLLHLWLPTPLQMRMRDLVGTGLRIPRGREDLLRGVLERAKGKIALQSHVPGWGGIEVPAQAGLWALLNNHGTGLRLRILARPLGKGGPQMLPGEGPELVAGTLFDEARYTRRDLAAEKASLQSLKEACPSLARATWDGAGWRMEDAVQSLTLLEELAPLDVALEWAADSRPRQVLGASDLQLQIQQEADWFSAQGSLKVDNGRVLELKELLQGLEPHSRFLPLGDGTFVALTEQNRQQLEQLRRLGQADEGGLRLHPLLAPVVQELQAGVQGDRSFSEHLARFRQAQSVEIVVPTTLQAQLRSYQEEGFRWLARLAEWGAGACLADDMGLGKTLQSLALLLRRAEAGPALVVAPTSVVGGWEEEAKRFAPTLLVLRFGDGNREEMLAKLGPGVVLLCSYGLLQSEEERLSQVAWNSLILDEAQQIKNSATQRFRAATALKANFRMACSGTPIENHLGELWSLFHFLSPGLLGSLAEFRKRFQLPIEQGNDADARAALQRLVRPFILRRTKAAVLTELPARTEVNLHVELGAEEAALYEALRRQALESLTNTRSEDPTWRLRVLAEITRLRQAACNARLVLPREEAPPSAKLTALGELIDSLREGGHKALIFSQFVRHLDLVREHLDARGIPYQYLDGSSTPTARKKSVKDFQAGQGDVFLISLRAGGTGLTLTAADYVIHLDPWWNPAVEDQASDRAHRMGQLRPVTIYRMVSQHTIEERIVALHQRKRDLATSLLEGADGQKLSAEDLLDLLSA